MTTGHNVADLVVILKILPTCECASLWPQEQNIAVGFEAQGSLKPKFLERKAVWKTNGKFSILMCVVSERIWPVTIGQCFSTGGDFAPQGIFGSVWRCPGANVFGQKPGLLLSILQYTRQTLPPNPKQRIIQANMALVPLTRNPAVEKGVCIQEEVSCSLSLPISLSRCQLPLVKVFIQLLVLAPAEIKSTEMYRKST